mgnify:FL=1
MTFKFNSKGFTLLDGAPVLVQFTMGQLEIGPADSRDNYHMVFIGPEMDQEAISANFTEVMVGAAS